MSSTEETLRAFFEAEIAPLADNVDLRHPSGWTTSSDDSYFVDRPDDAAIPVTRAFDERGPSGIAERMDSMWAGTPLEGMGANLMALAAEVEPGADDGTVSNVIYEMF